MRLKTSYFVATVVAVAAFVGYVWIYNNIIYTGESADMSTHASAVAHTPPRHTTSGHE